MINNYQLFIKNRSILILLGAGFALNLLLWGFFLIRVEPSLEMVPLHYNIYLGIDLLGPWYHLFYIPLFGLSILVVNTFLSYALVDRSLFLSFYLLSGMIFSQILLWCMSIYIILFNAF